MSKYFIEFSIFIILIFIATNYVLITEFILPADDRLASTVASSNSPSAIAQDVGRALKLEICYY